MVKLFKSFTPKPAKVERPPEAEAAKPKPAARPETAKSKTAKLDGTDGETLKRPKEIGGPEGPEPTRYGDWERGGRCFDF